ncbi:hypothetical protein G7K_6735-t1 [Saitoella complicata NRRL Y-17804]|uniref:Uncharacterized protein n=1 Tax=Saitoella complicata (strain BCRC 22490 / CBS 7301 / JCM 7358 / NBRC 10748 / NRRL Y-17804) TaxID=698492 RepID=A0A0E9NSB7_SAICN|nr:hypothetical protein G7K_6735-t1 [Saitoella complicata NRRL Y-17804]
MGGSRGWVLQAPRCLKIHKRHESLRSVYTTGPATSDVQTPRLTLRNSIMKLAILLFATALIIAGTTAAPVPGPDAEAYIASLQASSSAVAVGAVNDEKINCKRQSIGVDAVNGNEACA